MPIVVGVAFKPVGPISYFDPGPLELRVTDSVVVETAQGQELGIVKIRPRLVPDSEVLSPLGGILRRALPEDFARHERNAQRQADAFRVCREKIRLLNLSMTLIEADWAHDGSQVTFHFVAEGRIDFRELVRQIAGVLHTRVIMHQVGPRDHAKLLPAIGPCGRPTCCSTFLREFEPVSMRMAKGQNLALNPSKFSGLCGKLMCCLRYESEEDTPERAAMPQVGMVVMTPMGRAKVEEVNTIQEMLTVQLETQAFVEVRARYVSEVPHCVDHAEGGCTDCVSTGVLSNCSVPTRDKPTSGPHLPMA